MKRLLSLVLSVIFVITCFTACRPSKKTSFGSPLSIGSVQLDGEIFTYYLIAEYNKYSNRTDRTGAAVSDCVRYIAINTAFANYGLSLTDDEIAAATEQADNLWNMYGAWYKQAGVSKPTFVKIYIAGTYREKIRLAVYGEGGPAQISQDELKGCLAGYFTTYKLIESPMYSKNVYGNTQPFTEAEKDALRRKMSAAASYLNAGRNIESVVSEILVDFPLTECSYTTIVKGPSDHDVTAEFLEAIKAIPEGKASPLEMGDRVYVAIHTGILSDPSIYTEKKDEALELLSEGPLEEMIKGLCMSFSASKNDSAINSYYNLVEQVKLDNANKS